MLTQVKLMGAAFCAMAACLAVAGATVALAASLIGTPGDDTLTATAAGRPRIAA